MRPTANVTLIVCMIEISITRDEAAQILLSAREDGFELVRHIFYKRHRNGAVCVIRSTHTYPRACSQNALYTPNRKSTMPLKLIDGQHWQECPTGHESLTCKNHPNLRWSTKRIPGRSLFFGGKVTFPIKFYSDYSGVESKFTPECACPGNCLIPAPEDLFLRGKQSLEDYREAEQNNFIDDRIIGNMRD